MIDIDKLKGSLVDTVNKTLEDGDVKNITETDAKFFNNNDEILSVQSTSKVDAEIELLTSVLADRNQSNTDYVEKVFSKIKTISDDESMQEFINASDQQLISADTSTIDGVLNAVRGALSSTLGSIKELVTVFIDSTIGRTIIRGISSGVTALTATYKDGVNETDYGQAMQGSWVGKGSRSFLDTFVKEDNFSRKIRVMASTPLDPGEDQRSALFGSLMMGCPYTYGGLSDPRNRQFINTFVKDGRFASFTPGFPKYNGGYYTQGDSNILNQTQSGSEMLNYLLKNGLDNSFTEKDKRFYTFSADYETYYAYLEAMLTPIWLKLGLGTVDNNTFDIFSFFDIKKPSVDGQSGNVNPSGAGKLKAQYRSSMGFFLNGPAGVSESTSSDMTSYGAETSNYVNDQSEAYQRINYFTGMGTGGTARDVFRTGAAGVNMIKHTKNVFLDVSGNARSMAGSGADIGKKTGGSTRLGQAIGGLVGWGVGLAAGAALDILSVTGERDLSAIVQSFSVTNGIKIVHPELWSDSNYSRGINLNFDFTSPYGDPMSIFKFVYVPFCALLCLALPRAAADNGYVSPMFVRCDIPGLVTTDLGMISDMTWTKGGSANIWSKDNLPRAMSVSITVSDLYPFLAMSKRYSFLSANPSFMTFLDNLSGLCTIYGENAGDDPLNSYWKRMLNRVNGVANTDGLWNKYNQDVKNAYNSVNQTPRSSVSAKSSGVNYSTISWMDKV